MNYYETTMTFKSGPALTVIFLCFGELDAAITAKAEALRGGFGVPKKMTIKKLSDKGETI